jgi:hypothetical protein
MQEVNSKPKLASDGHSWLINYVCQLMATFSQFSREYVLDELPMAEGWVYFVWAMDNDPVAKILGGQRGPRFIKHEIDRLIEEAVKLEPRWKIK